MASIWSTRDAFPDDEYSPFAPDGTWRAPWPPEIWLVKWRLQALGYRMPVSKTTLTTITDMARLAYVERYGYEPPRRGRRNRAYTCVFEHDRVSVIDEAAAGLHALLGSAVAQKGAPDA